LLISLRFLENIGVSFLGLGGKSSVVAVVVGDETAEILFGENQSSTKKII
jgi:hypothetical protein